MSRPTALQKAFSKSMRRNWLLMPQHPCKPPLHAITQTHKHAHDTAHLPVCLLDPATPPSGLQDAHLVCSVHSLRSSTLLRTLVSALGSISLPSWSAPALRSMPMASSSSRTRRMPMKRMLKNRQLIQKTACTYILHAWLKRGHEMAKQPAARSCSSPRSQQRCHGPQEEIELWPRS